MKKYILIAITIVICNTFVKAQNKDNPDKRGYIVKVGDIAPDFVINYANGKEIKLSDLRGKIVMLQFTASWCGVCRKEMPFIETEVWKHFKDSGLVVIGIDRGEPTTKVKKFAKDMKITYPLALDEKSEIFTLFADKKAGVTRNVIIDKKGKIVYLTRLFERKEFNEMKKTIVQLLHKK